MTEEFYEKGRLISRFKEGHYEHTDGYSLSVPNGWVKVITKRNVAAFAPTKKLNDNNVKLVESITIISKHVSDTLDFASMIDLEVNATRKQLTSFKIRSRRVSKFPYENRAEIIYEGTMGTVDNTVRLVLSLKANQLVVISCLAPSDIFDSEFKNISKRVVSSFSLKGLEPDA